MKPQHSYSKQRRLRSSEEFQELYRQARRLRGSFINLLYRKLISEEPSRFGIAVGRKYGSSVTRNRIRRLVRENLRQRLSHFPLGYHVVIEILPQAKTMDAPQFRVALDLLLEKAIKQFESPSKKNSEGRNQSLSLNNPVALCC